MSGWWGHGRTSASSLRSLRFAGLASALLALAMFVALSQAQAAHAEAGFPWSGTLTGETESHSVSSDGSNHCSAEGTESLQLVGHVEGAALWALISTEPDVAEGFLRQPLEIAAAHYASTCSAQTTNVHGEHCTIVTTFSPTSYHLDEGDPTFHVSVTYGPDLIAPVVPGVLADGTIHESGCEKNSTGGISNQPIMYLGCEAENDFVPVESEVNPAGSCMREHEGEGETSRDKETWNLHLSPTVDSDGDGIPDVQEIETTHTSPISPDTDGDEFPDGTDQCPTVAARGTAHGCPEAGPPEFGRCAKVAKGSGTFKSSGCTTEAAGGSYRWTPGVVKTGVTLSGAASTFETASKAKISCKAAHGQGSYTGTRGITGIALTLTGCESLGHACTSTSAAQGEIVSAALEGVLRWESKPERKVLLALSAKGGGPLLQMTCTGLTREVTGAVLVKVKADKMATAQALKFTDARGKQKPAQYESAAGEQISAFLESNLGGSLAQTGLKAALTMTSEEAVEISAFV